MKLNNVHCKWHEICTMRYFDAIPGAQSSTLPRRYNLMPALPSSLLNTISCSLNVHGTPFRHVRIDDSEHTSGLGLAPTMPQYLVART